MKRIYCITYVCLLGFLGIGTLVQADDSSLTILKRSSQTLKFESHKTQDMTIVSRKGFLQKMNDSKEDAAQKKQNKQKQPTQQTSQNTFTISSEFLEAKNTYKVTVMDSTSGGIIISDQLLQEAPADGYQASAECSLPVQSKAYEVKKYIYLKTKTDGGKSSDQYSRLELDMTIGKAKLIVDMDSVTNPDGSKNLRYNKKAQQKVVTLRLKEIEKAMKNKTATPEQTEEMQELMMLQAQDAQDHNRWDFEGNHERLIQQKRQRLLEADGRLRPKKRTIEKVEAESSSIQKRP